MLKLSKQREQKPIENQTHIHSLASYFCKNIKQGLISSDTALVILQNYVSIPDFSVTDFKARDSICSSVLNVLQLMIPDLKQTYCILSASGASSNNSAFVACKDSFDATDICSVASQADNLIFFENFKFIRCSTSIPCTFQSLSCSRKVGHSHIKRINF